MIILLPPHTAESVSGYMDGYGIIKLAAVSSFTRAVSTCVGQPVCNKLTILLQGCYKVATNLKVCHNLVPNWLFLYGIHC